MCVVLGVLNIYVDFYNIKLHCYLIHTEIKYFLFQNLE